ncbi:MAG: hypothetical protein JRJ80_17360 [Deltaproteobacteria bacterium]|nr:hypothetical protein [Deltaproteobacteria bacterium]MBW2159723.1 hypothetical protein [Deltaproteobacteria bacterium]
MRYLVGFVCVMALVALPQSGSAQAGEEGTSAEPSGEQPAQPTPSPIERWHPEAFVDPSKPASEPALKLEVDSTALQVTPTAPPTLEELERRAFEDLERLEEKTQGEKKRPERRRAIGIAVGVIVGAAVVGLAIGGAVAMSNWEL